jgi:hypothetical protein
MWVLSFEKLSAEVVINRACETLRENIETSAIKRPGCCELKKYKPWFGEECS